MPPRSVSFAEGTLEASDSPPRYNRANAHVSNTLPNLEENRAELRCNMHGKITLLSVETFLETFFPSIDIENPSQPNIFHKMKTPTSERQMYEELPTMLNAAGITSKFTFVANPYQSDQTDPSKQSVDCGMYLNEHSPEPEGGAVYARVDWSNLDLSIECKCHTTEQDPLDDATDNGEPTADKRQEALGQILSYAELVFRYQHRMFHFMILFLGTEARIVRFDRSGIFATHKFSLKDEGHWLVEFLCAYTALSPVERGYDPTVTRVVRGSASWKAMKQKANTVDDKDPRDYVRELFKTSLDEEWPWWLIEVHPEPSKSGKRQLKRRFLVGKPHFQAPGVAGRGTRGYVALPANAKGQPLKSGKFVYLKDAWRVDYPDIEQEGKVLEFLNEKDVPYIPTLVVHGDVPNQVTESQDLWPLFNPKGKRCPLKRHTHYRLVVAEVGRPLESFGDNSWELITALMCCIQAHESAYKAGVLHRDISSGNVLLYKQDNGAWCGLLNDWELSKKIDYGAFEGRQPDRTGTWQFMSVHALNDPLRKMVIQDELESFFHVLLHYAIRFLPHNLKDDEVGRFLHEYFDAAAANANGYCCGKTKSQVVETGIIKISTYNGVRDPENATLRFLWPTPPVVAPPQVEPTTPSKCSSRSSSPGPSASPSYIAIFDPNLTPLPSQCTPPPDEEAWEERMEQAPKPVADKDHPMNHIINELLSWFKAYYSFDIAPRRRAVSGNVVPTDGMVPRRTAGVQLLTKHKSDNAIGGSRQTRAAVAAAASTADLQRDAENAKRSELEDAQLAKNRELSAKLEDHSAILALLDEALDKVWPVGDKQADKKPAKGFVPPKRLLPQGSTTSRTASKRRARDEPAGDASEPKPSKRSRA